MDGRVADGVVFLKFTRGRPGSGWPQSAPQKLKSFVDEARGGLGGGGGGGKTRFHPSALCYAAMLKNYIPCFFKFENIAVRNVPLLFNARAHSLAHQFSHSPAYRYVFTKTFCDTNGSAKRHQQ